MLPSWSLSLRYGAFLLMLAAPKMLKAEQPSTKRSHAFSLSLGNQRHLFRSGKAYVFSGTSTVISGGYSKIGQRYYILGEAQYFSGPTETYNPKIGPMNYQGTGLAVTVGFNAEPFSIRTDQGNYGFVLGLAYVDLSGRMSDLSRGINPPGETYAQLVARLSSINALAGIFFGWFEEERPNSNKPDMLLSRVEGYLLALGLNTSLINSYKTSLKVIKGNGIEYQKQRGSLAGYSLSLSLSILIGT